MKTPACLPRQSGMTLVEVLLVVFIVGLVAGIAVMTLPERTTPREKAVADLERSLRDIRDMSVLTGDTMALRSADGAISLMRWDGYEWKETGRSLANLPDGVQVRLAAADDRRRPDPQESRMLVFDPLGVSEPASLIVTYRGFERTLSIGADGEVTLEPVS